MFVRAAIVGMLLLASACFASKLGEVQSSKDNPFVTIAAGEIDYGPGSGNVRLWYLIDRQTQTCWLTPGGPTPIDCCAVHRVSQARQYITWGNCPDDDTAPAAH